MKALKRTAFLFLAMVITFCSSMPVYAASENYIRKAESVMSAQLIKTLNSVSSTDIIRVVVWIEDINHTLVEEEVKVKTGLKKSEIKDELGTEKINNYISEKRKVSSNKYKASNNSFLNKVTKSNKSVEIIFQSTLSPMLILKANKGDIYSIANIKSVISMDIHKEITIEDESLTANDNSDATYMRDTMAATGAYTSNGSTNKIKIGQIELAVPDLANYAAYFDTADCHNFFTSNVARSSIHATLVAAIMVGKPYTVGEKTYTGIAPDAELYSCGITYPIDAYNDEYILQMFYGAVEKLVRSTDGGCGVNIINMSMGLPLAGGSVWGEYDATCQWVDHIAYHHDVHFVKSAGNVDTADKHITSPGLAYNAITVGSFNDKGNSINSHAPSTLANQYLDSSDFSISDSSCYIGGYDDQPLFKPDIIAAGENIEYGQLYYNGENVESNDGTSFAAPQVSGIIAQLCSKRPSLLTKQNTVKAILAASAVYRLAGDNEYDYGETSLLEKQGAGVVNARAAYTVVSNFRYKEINLPGTTHYYTTTINVPDSYEYLRVAMTWIRKADASNCTTEPGYSYYILPNLKLEVFKGTDTSGTPCAVSDIDNNNLELLQFEVEEGGTYTIRITNYAYISDFGTQHIALAWY